mmetsp:Transcript_34299/g.79116  ORF Transcript_34299/g.79116 Transcript_34299/m.79116 type:complete len:248 (-) Transcript_34299:34-777(-)
MKCSTGGAARTPRPMSSKKEGLWPEGRKPENVPKCGEQATEIQRDYEKWHTWTAIIGFPVMGVLPRGFNPEDMNVVAVSRGSGGKEGAGSRGRLLVGASDNGEVFLFNYPSVIQNGPYYAFNGHSSFVKNVCWVADDSRVITAGGLDRAMLQWTVKWKADKGYLGYRGSSDSTQVQSVPTLAAPTSAAPKAVADGKAVAAADSTAAAAEEKRRAQEQASAVSRLETQMRAMEQQQATLRNELARLKS